MEVTTTDAREHFAEFINQVAYGSERVTLTRRGQNIAAIVSARDLELLEMIEDAYDVEMATVAREDAKKNGVMTMAELRASL